MLGLPFFSGMGTLGAVALGVALGSGMGWAVQKWQDAGRLQRLRGEVAQAQAVHPAASHKKPAPGRSPKIPVQKILHHMQITPAGKYLVQPQDL